MAEKYEPKEEELRPIIERLLEGFIVEVADGWQIATAAKTEN